MAFATTAQLPSWHLWSGALAHCPHLLLLSAPMTLSHHYLYGSQLATQLVLPYRPLIISPVLPAPCCQLPPALHLVPQTPAPLVVGILNVSFMHHCLYVLKCLDHIVSLLCCETSLAAHCLLKGEHTPCLYPHLRELAQPSEILRFFSF